MGTCCTTRDKSYSSDLTSRQLDHNGLNEIQRSLQYLTNYLDQNREAQILALCYSKDQLGNFITILSQVLTIIRMKTSKIFAPISVQNSPFNPEHEMIIILSAVDKLDKYSIDREETLDETRLAKQFVIRSFQFLTSDPSDRNNQLKNDLINMYKNDGLMIVGGIQDPGKVNKIQFLMYKTDQNRVGSQGANASYDIQIKFCPQETDAQSFDQIINEAQMESNQQLRSVISFEDTYSRYHFIVLQTFIIDRLYLCNNFPKKIAEENQYLRDSMNGLTKSPQSLRTSPGGTKKYTPTLENLDPFAVKMNLSEKLSIYLNAQEKKMQSSIIELIVNNSYNNSYIVSTQ